MKAQSKNIYNISLFEAGPCSGSAVGPEGRVMVPVLPFCFLDPVSAPVSGAGPAACLPWAGTRVQHPQQPQRASTCLTCSCFLFCVVVLSF